MLLLGEFYCQARSNCKQNKCIGRVQGEPQTLASVLVATGKFEGSEVLQQTLMTPYISDACECIG